MRKQWTIRWVSLAVALGAAAAVPPPGGAEITDCREITSLPATIVNRGIYCLRHNLATADPGVIAISVEADDVVIDLNGHRLDGSAAGLATKAVGVRTVNHSNVTVRNGSIRGFASAIQLLDTTDSRGHVVEGIKADGSTLSGLDVEGRGVRVTGNQVLNTGGSTAVLPSGPPPQRAYGIIVNGPGAVVSDNLVEGTTSAAGSYAYGIHATRSDGAVIEHNQILNETLSPATSYGILIPFSQDVLVVGNRMTKLTGGIWYSSYATGKYRDNLTSGVATPYDGGGPGYAIDAGNNN